MDRRRVVITGLGCVTALAESVNELYAALCAGKSGVSTIECFDASAYPVHFGGEIKHFDVTKYIDKREAKRMDRFTQRGCAKVNIQWQLYCLVHNIEKILHYGFSFG